MKSDLDEFFEFMQEESARIVFGDCYLIRGCSGSWAVYDIGDKTTSSECLIYTDKFRDALNCLKENG